MAHCELAIFDVDTEDFQQCPKEATHSGGEGEVYAAERWVESKEGQDFDIWLTDDTHLNLCDEHATFVQDKINERAMKGL